MFMNYLTIALRNIIRHKLYSFINIAGLAVGLTSVIFVILFVRDELSYDKWIPDSENIYQVETTFHMPGKAPDFVSAVPFVATIACAILTILFNRFVWSGWSARKRPTRLTTIYAGS